MIKNMSFTWRQAIQTKSYTSVLSKSETVWDMTTDIGWADVFSLGHAQSVRDAARAELGLELKIEEFENDDDD